MTGRRRRWAFAPAALVPLLVAGGMVAAGGPALAAVPADRPTGPPATRPAGVSTERGPAPVPVRVRTIELGSASRPAGGVRVERRQPVGVPLDDDAGPPAAAPRVLRATASGTTPFSAVGVSWRADRGLGPVSVAVRSRAGDATPWSAWSASGADEADPTAGRTPAAGTGRPRVRGGSELVWVGPSRAVEVVVTGLSGRQPEDIRVDLIDPGTGAVDTAAALPNEPSNSPPSDSPPTPPRTTGGGGSEGTVVPRATVSIPPAASYGNGVVRIYSRAAWGADPRWMTWTPEYAPAVKAVVVHHTATTNAYRPEDVPAILRSIYRFQAISRGWGDVGYNALVDKYGRVWEGRAGGLATAVIGAHAGGFNTGTSGVALIGDFTATAPTYRGRSAVAHYMAFKLGSYGVDPLATVPITGGPSTKIPDPHDDPAAGRVPARLHQLHRVPGPVLPAVAVLDALGRP